MPLSRRTKLLMELTLNKARMILQDQMIEERQQQIDKYQRHINAYSNLRRLNSEILECRKNLYLIDCSEPKDKVGVQDKKDLQALYQDKFTDLIKEMFEANKEYEESRNAL